ncbi:DNA-directed RNA polymerase subunit alpha C-terminal domain-containing protein [Novosphingobium sp. BL-8H]|uniref:DNA-directed RNA polymerase subunit alpha C-terminal domain-containing protein n=1 Tax=Novosphingobium sp. BL-8H TaxID=3127640 RepID=UPI0037573153
MGQHNDSQVAAAEDRRNHVMHLRSQGLTFREISGALGVSVFRANQLYNRARVLLREQQRTIAGTITPLTPIEELPISSRAVKALRFAGLERVEDILPLDREQEQRLLALPNFARVCLNELRAATRNLATPDPG